MDINNSKIAIIGLGYVGLPLAVEFGKVRPVLGFDINEARIAELVLGKDSTLEVTPEDAVATAGNSKSAASLSSPSRPPLILLTVLI